jgi:DNA-binding NtrC family response regulator
VARILVVDDQPALAEMIVCALDPLGHAADVANDGGTAIEQLGRADYDVVITDIKMPGADGFAVLSAARALARAPEVVIITGFATIPDAVRAMKAGAADYLAKPLDVVALQGLVRRLLAERAAPADAGGGDFAGMIGRTEPMRQLYALIDQVAATPSTVVIHGESGSGKELVARAIHERSPRSGGPFVAVDCGALPENLLESELFGHVKGAFTGAIENKAGLFEAADGGTVFLDEIGELPLRLQQKLLRCLQERAVRPVGSTSVRAVDVRVIVATNRDLGRMVTVGEFRKDLFYRLNVVPIPVPPLRDRADDIPLLAQHFAAAHAERMGRPAPAVSDTALAALTAAPWPGNVRQLENVIECAVMFATRDSIDADDLPNGFDAAEPSTGSSLPPLSDAVGQLERQMLTKALDISDGNKERAARLLGIDRATLYRKLKSHELTASR